MGPSDKHFRRNFLIFHYQTQTQNGHTSLAKERSLDSPPGKWAVAAATFIGFQPYLRLVSTAKPSLIGNQCSSRQETAAVWPWPFSLVPDSGDELAILFNFFA